MINELLAAKYRAQRALSEKGGDDLAEYAGNIHKIVQDVERIYGFRFQYRPAIEEKKAYGMKANDQTGCSQNVIREHEDDKH